MNEPLQILAQQLPEDLLAALDAESRRRQQPLAQTVISLLRASLVASEVRTNGLERFAGDWSAEELAEFLQNTSLFREVDSEIWC